MTENSSSYRRSLEPSRMSSPTKDDKWQVNAKDVLHPSWISQDKTCLIQTISQLLPHCDLDKQELEHGQSSAYISHDLWILFDCVEDTEIQKKRAN